MDRWLLYAGCVLMSGCVLDSAERTVAPEPTRFVQGTLEIHADFPLDPQHPTLRELTDLRGRVAATLDLPLPPQSIHVYLFASSERFHAMLVERFPQFPVRRAFFVKHAGRFEVYAQWTDHAAEDLRHETTHAYLHTAVANLPLWLDEGLAEFFETSPAAAGWNRPHAEMLLQELHRGGWRPDLRRLEMLSSSGEMTQLDYAEAWAWAYLLLATTPEHRNRLRDYVRALQEGTAMPPLSEILARGEVSPNDALLIILHERQAQLHSREATP